MHCSTRPYHQLVHEMLRSPRRLRSRSTIVFAVRDRGTHGDAPGTPTVRCNTTQLCQIFTRRSPLQVISLMNEGILFWGKGESDRDGEVLKSATKVDKEKMR